MAVVDWLIVVVLVVSVLSAAKKGFFLEVFSLAGVIAGLLIASWNYQRLMPWFSRWITERQVAEAIAFLAISLGVMILAGLVGRLIRWSVRSIGLGWVDRLIGAAFGFVKGCVLVVIAVLAVAAFLPKATWFQQSRLVPYFLDAAHQASIATPVELGQRIREGVTVLRKTQLDWINRRPF
jgi:membrane protein required for colicin V production